MKIKLSIACVLVVLVAVVSWGERRKIEKFYLGWQIYRLRADVIALEEQHIRNIPAHQIFDELTWIYEKTRNYPRVRERIGALKAALNDPACRDAVDEQSPVDGSWGRWYTEWFFKLNETYEHIAALAQTNETPKYPIRMLDVINSPEKLTAHLNRLLVSNLAADRIDHRRELNETLSVLIRLLVRGQPADYPFHPGLKAAGLDWLMNTARNPETGYWGEQYLQNGQLIKTNDISITFHIVSYLNGQVPDWPKIIDTTLAIKGVKYGWMTSNHDQMDVVEIFRLGWTQGSATQQQAMRAEMQQMLDWCLKESLKPDGSFTVDQESIESSEYFGASFLVHIGYFDRARRFWTDQEFPHAAEDREHIINFIRAHFATGGAGGGYYRGALSQLGAEPPK